MVDYQKILFICTGNFYRSRFAEAVFNHDATRRNLPWRAFSRGLGIHLADGDLSSETRAALLERGISAEHTAPTRISLTEHDLQSAGLTIAMKQSEHLPMMLERFPHWAGLIDYWSIHDIDVDIPASVLPSLERKVLALVQSLSEGCADGREPSPLS